MELCIKSNIDPSADRAPLILLVIGPLLAPRRHAGSAKSFDRSQSRVLSVALKFLWRE